MISNDRKQSSFEALVKDGVKAGVAVVLSSIVKELKSVNTIVLDGVHPHESMLEKLIRDGMM